MVRLEMQYTEVEDEENTSTNDERQEIRQDFMDRVNEDIDNADHGTDENNEEE